MPSTRALLLGALSTLIAVGCGPDPRRRTRAVEPERVADEAVSKQALASFAAVVKRYEDAKAKGPLGKRACKELQHDFLALYEEHGRGLAVAKFDAGAIAQQCGDVDEAQKLYEELVRAMPSHALAHNNLGVIWWERGQEAKALESFTRAVQADSTSTAPRNNLAAALREKYAHKPEPAQFTRAEDEAQRVLALDSGNRLAYENLARLYYDRGRLQDRSYLLLAQLVIAQALAKVKDGTLDASAELHNLQGLLMMERADPVGALRAFKKSVELDELHTDAHLNIALVAIRFRDYETAEHSLERALTDREQQRNVDAYLGLGVAQRGLRKYGAAQKSFEKAVELDDDDPRGLYNLGILYHDHLGPANDRKSDEFDAAPYMRAKGYFEKFVARAGKQQSLAGSTAEAKRRIAGIVELLENAKQMDELLRQQKAMEALARKQQEEEKQRLLEAERQLQRQSQ
jgi:tetratricopeptide (TPR) repeat protein